MSTEICSLYLIARLDPRKVNQTAKRRAISSEAKRGLFKTYRKKTCRKESIIIEVKTHTTALSIKHSIRLMILSTSKPG